ncbi:conjugal transfer protein MobB [Chryseobacterium sp. MA9]|uniref:conjugal transfer protein MobB n=1 Tax=Chryseobacterium sp. MA9 TaxID=2966625 RepID=UPI0021030DD3|nr:conjugal transfer protein MobB [Chryseobacterium sp. MA9]UTX48848.1 relaxase/mobilization nuclease domain-containing protein [Chryseobacterium sp. MA9]
MVAKIGRSSNLYGALAYNHNKVEQEKGKILFMNKMVETPNGRYTIPQLAESFDPYLAANRNTEKYTLHLSLNPDPKDKVSETYFIKMAEEYMKEMGYGEQPYIIFKHTDIDRTHLHIVSVCVDENGRKISDKFEKRRSMEICRKLEKTYNLLPAVEQKSSENSLIFSPVDYHKGNVKRQIASVIRNIPGEYSFKTLGEYNALLSLFNIAVEKIEGELHGEPQRGLVYFALDKNKNKIGHPFKASRIGKNAGLAALELHFLKSKELVLNSSGRSEIKTGIDNVLKYSKGENDFVKRLNSWDISTVVRRNESGRIYGITFIDHHSKTVWNGSNLGKQYSANAFNDLWKDQQNMEKASELKFPLSKSSPSDQLRSDQLHPLFGFLKNESSDNPSNDETSVLFPGLLPLAEGEDHEEEVFARQISKRKRKRKW